MGEARRRGSFEKRRKVAIQRNKEKLIGQLGHVDEKMDAALRAGISPFLKRLAPEEWQSRRAQILEALKQVHIGSELAKARPIRVQDDEIIWYLFLCQQALEDPLCMDVSQASRAAPFFAAIGLRWEYAHRVKGLEQKIDEVLHKYRDNPDGLIFEILVALAYAEKGWEVELLEARSPAKSPDMLVTKDGVELYVECKRLARRTGYSAQERDDFLKLWDAAVPILVKQRQWVWFKCLFHVEVGILPPDFLVKLISGILPIDNDETLVYDGPEAIIHARLIDQSVVRNHMAKWCVKENSPQLNQLLGGDWAPMNSSVTTLIKANRVEVVDCDVYVLNGYIDEISWACGITREFDSETSINKKAKDITKHLADAVQQVPKDRPSIIHIAAETMEGKVVEQRRTKKVMDSIPGFVTDKPVLAVRFHRFQANQVIDKLWEFDETTERFNVDGFPEEDIPEFVVVSDEPKKKTGSHWELYH